MHVFVSGRPSLDLLGTLKWRRDDPDELLHTTADVRAWFAAAGHPVSVAPSTGDVVRVHDVREALYRTVTAARAGSRPARSDVALVNAVAAEPGPELRLTADGTVRRSATVEQALADVVRDGLDLLAGEQLRQVKDCANPRCTRLFLDTSRGGSRRWCGMTECGNAAKVAAFRARQR
ncbi:CGNR zinc finger domain-containing protein [Jatrophihabitans sp. YIM 134969]